MALALADKLKYLRRHHGLSKEALLAWSALGTVEGLVDDLVQRCLQDCAGELSGVRDEHRFEELCLGVRNHIVNGCLATARLLNDFLPLQRKLSRVVSGDMELRRPEVFEDISSQLEDLIYPGFLVDLEPGRLRHYPRYLRAVDERIRQLKQDPARDTQRMAAIQPWWNRYQDALQDGSPYNEAMDRFRWLLEEYRVSLFAQRLGTAVKVSEKRLAEAWREVNH